MDKLQELLTRGVANIIPNKKKLEEKLSSGEKLNIYLGIDPTATRIHLGHTVALRKLQRFADLGHNVTFLVGDYTAKVGDTSDKEGERPQLSDEDIKENLKTYKEQASKIVDFNKIKIKFNSEWLKDLNLNDILELIGKFTLNDFISRELIKKRLNEGKSIGLLETLYPIMQGYDSFALDTDIQIGGTDQTFNMQAGRQLLKSEKESFIITTEFLSGTDGRKMSKTWGNAIWLTDDPNDIYGKVMSITDKVIIEYFTLVTDISLEEIKGFEEELKSKPMDLKKRLAYIIVSELYDEKRAESAKRYFERTIQDKKEPLDIPEFPWKNKGTILDLLVESSMAKSKSEAKRLLGQEGVKVNGDTIIYDPNEPLRLKDGHTLSVGRKFVRITIR